jgi:predicted anti-sigma-YlaC factor YlaD
MPGGSEYKGFGPMTCEEFAHACLELGAEPAESPVRLAALEHLRLCPQCAALQINLQTLQDDLRYLGLETRDAETPSRVQMRLMQEFRTRHKTVKARRFALAGVWALVAAAVIAIAVSWTNWRRESPLEGGAPVATTHGHPPSPAHTAAGLEIGDTLVASSATGDFTLLPGSTPSPMEDATVVRVQMQRGALGALGLTVNEEHAADLIQVDLLVGDDGLPQAVRLPQAIE